VDLDAEADLARGEEAALQSAPIASERQSGSSFQRIYKVFLTARVALGLALLATQAALSYLGSRPDAWVLMACTGYAVQTVVSWLLSRFRQPTSPQAMAQLRSPQWLGSIGVDLAVFTALHALDGGSSLNFVALLVLPILMSGLMTPRLMALATTAGVTLVLLATAWLSVLQGFDPALRMTQSGLAGSGLFIVTLLAAELASRLAREERSARGSMDLARQQAQLNRLVIDEMQEGVLVVDRRGRVRAANPAARALLSVEGLVREAPFQLRGVRGWEPLVTGIESAFALGQWPIDGADVNLQFASDHLRALRVKVRFTRRQASRATEELCVLFLEDLRTVQARSRQEKLAAMGRVSAGIAHEIRNPLAAIDQANALLTEDCHEPGQRRLTSMVSSNVQRLKRIVDDVMALAPGATAEASSIEVCLLLFDICQDWARANQVEMGEQGMLKLELPAHSLRVHFEPDHLRRVLVNLLDNAYRHAQPGVGALAVTVRAPSDEWVELCVFSQGEQIAPEVERHLFEPFFSTRSRGTGLGLYICRELCERYGGNIEYKASQQDQRKGNQFVVTLRRHASTSGSSALPSAIAPTSQSSP
jgi:two-component system sensor histidine kinase PilS (NtrC family)